ncbi:DotH/IcmK family type IV secretion protein [Shewanella aestuarii]|uniref:Type IV secretion protein DotH n=1 Tax=Shewanella aestuarii TaxID=1028752 RepID=A0A6G9QQ19_9GAMM|nr:DotH/IcmK family type IV secretion protein [Shewanella aestuarii]QIR16518.1 hypothetical protein HBH39_18755 [Shewanella aestuarii]
MIMTITRLPIVMLLLTTVAMAETTSSSPTADIVLPTEVIVEPIPAAHGIVDNAVIPNQITQPTPAVQSVQVAPSSAPVQTNQNIVNSGNFPKAEFKESQDGIHEEAIMGLFAGMTPEQIRQVKLMSEMLLEAKSSQVTPLTPSQDVVVMNLSPGGQPPTIRTREGFNTVISFLDTLGKPWPIEWSLPGNSAYEEIDSQGDKPITHTIVLNAKAKYETTNYTVKLLGLDDPLMFILVNTIHGTTDFKITYKIPKIGPNTEYELTNSANGTAITSSTNSILDINIDELDQFFTNPPAKANVIPVSLPQIASVWYHNGFFIVKTRHELAEDYERITYGPNGWKVYAVRNIDYEMVVVTEDGMVQVALPAELVHNYSTMDSKS